MRRSALLLTLPLAWVACFSNSSGGPPGAAFDASSDSPEFDSSTPDVTQEAAADASLEAAMEAAPPVDAPAETTPEAGPAPVVITVGGFLGLESGVTLVWGDSTGAVVATGTTSAAGTATQALAGTTISMVTAVLGTPSSPWLFTIEGVEPGDNLVIIDQSSIALLRANGVTLTTLPSPLPASESSLMLWAGACGVNFQAPPATFGLENSYPQQCIGVGPSGTSFGAAYPALVDANDANFNLLGFVFANNNLLTMPDDSGELDLSLGSGTWSSATTSQVITQANRPSSGFQDGYANYSEVANGAMLPLPQRSPAPDAGLPADSTLFTTHQGYADFVQTELFYNPDHDGFVQEGYAITTRAPAPTADGTTTVDWTSFATLPSITNITVDSTTLAQPILRWTTVSGTLAASTGIIAYTTWSGPDPEGGKQNGSWTLVSAGTAQASLQAPALPAASSAWTPVAGSTFGGSTVYSIAGGTALPGYGQVRAASSLFQMQNQCISNPMAPPLPSAGTLMMVGYTSGGCG